MNSLINTKELCKRIKSSGTVIWIREETQHFITNRHFLIRFDELPRDVMIALFSVFCKIPEIRQTLTSHHGGEVINDKPVNVKGFYKPEEQTVEGVRTAYRRVLDEKRKLHATVIKFPDRVAYLDCDYTALVYDGGSIKSMSDHNQPVYMANGDLIILPYRMQEDDTFINELLSEGDPSAEDRS
jgi:hypothetical protein